jgi:hypothetical protein
MKKAETTAVGSRNGDQRECLQRLITGISKAPRVKREPERSFATAKRADIGIRGIGATKEEAFALPLFIK